VCRHYTNERRVRKWNKRERRDAVLDYSGRWREGGSNNKEALPPL